MENPVMSNFDRFEWFSNDIHRCGVWAKNKKCIKVFLNKHSSWINYRKYQQFNSISYIFHLLSVNSNLMSNIYATTKVVIRFSTLDEIEMWDWFL